MSCRNSFSGFSNDGCKDDHVQDKVCINGSRTIATAGAVGAEQIYFSNTIVDATGYIKILTTPADAVITVTFLLNAASVHTTTLTIGEVVAFTVLDFNTITIQSSVVGTVAFELSLTPRYTI